MTIRRSLVCAATFALAACGSGGQRAPDATFSGERWTGSFQPMQQRVSTITQAGHHKVTGNVILSPSTRNAERTRISVSVSSAAHQSGTLRWAVLPGRCGVQAFALLPQEQFPTLEISANGRGQVEAELPLRLEYSNAYHVNIYGGFGTQLTDVVSCANLRQS